MTRSDDTNRARQPRAEAAPIPDRYSRQTLFAPLGPEGQARVMAGRAVLIGCGGLGTVIAEMLVRAGIGFLRIVDRDLVEESNLQRQLLFDTADVTNRIPKAEAARRRLTAVNPGPALEAVVRHVDRHCIGELVADTDVILDGSDNFELRYLINDAAVKRGTPWCYGAAVGSCGLTTAILPGRTPCLRCLFPDPPPPGAAATCDTAGILAPVLHAVAAAQVTDAIKILSRRGETGNVMHHIDVWERQFRSVDVSGCRTPDCPTCGLRRFTYLDGDAGTTTTSLCGRNAVQVASREQRRLDLEALAERLRQRGKVVCNPFVVKYSGPDAAFTVFADGRAIVEGTTDPDKALGIYARYIGN